MKVTRSIPNDISAARSRVNRREGDGKQETWGVGLDKTWEVDVTCSWPCKEAAEDNRGVRNVAKSSGQQISGQGSQNAVSVH